MLGVLVEGNRGWAQHVPALMLSVAKLTFTHNGKPNAHALYDTGAATAILAVQAAAMGMQAHQMAGYDAAKAREVFAIPEDFQPGAAIAVGYYAGDEHVPEEFRKRDHTTRQRKPLASMVFTGRWGDAAPFAQ
jgi:nitroreductase